MAIPDFQSLLLPVLKLVGKQQTSSNRMVVDSIIQEFKLTAEEVAHLLPSQTQRTIDNRCYWALVYLQKAGLLERVARGLYSVSPTGHSVLNDPPDQINTKFLEQYESFRLFKKKTDSNRSSTDDENDDVLDTDFDPEESFQKAFDVVKNSVCDELLTYLRGVHPTRFENIVLELLQRLGYASNGGSTIHRGGSGDGGIDGEINQDALGFDKIYVQAKRYAAENGVGRPDIQKFVGSLHERRATKGLFITSSYFSKEAIESASKFGGSIVLIDGDRLAELMFNVGLGVETKMQYALKKVNSDYFEE